MQRTVYQAAGPAWVLGAHARAAATLEAQGAPALTCALHVERSAQVGDEQAIALLRTAGQQALGSSPAAAGRWFGAAASLLPEERHGSVAFSSSRSCLTIPEPDGILTPN